MSIDDDLFGPAETDPDDTARLAQRRDDLLAVLATASGRRVLARLIAQSGVLGVVSSELDEGRRRLGLALLAETEAADGESHRSLMMEVLHVR